MADPAWVGFCNGYVQGIYDSLSASNEGLCIPAGTARAAIVEMVVRQLTNRSELKEAQAAVVVHAALAKSYPCS